MDEDECDDLEYQYDSDEEEYRYEEDDDENNVDCSQGDSDNKPAASSTNIQNSIPIVINPTNNNSSSSSSTNNENMGVVSESVAQSYDSSYMKVDNDDHHYSSYSSSYTSVNANNLTNSSSVDSTSSSSMLPNNNTFKTPARIDKKNNTASMTQSGKLKIPDGTFFISEYSVISAIMENLVNEVSSLLDLDYDVALLLLQSCRWNKEKLMDQFYSSSESSEKLIKECGVDLYSKELLKPLEMYKNNYQQLSNIQNVNNIIAKMDPIAKIPVPSPITSLINNNMSSSSSSMITSTSTSPMSNLMSMSAEQQQPAQSQQQQFQCEICSDVNSNIEAVGLGMYIYCIYH